MADAILSTPDDVTPVLGDLITEGLVDSTAGAYTLTEREDQPPGASATERTRWGADSATAALDAFLDIDHRVKDVVTAWQMRDPQTPNDHRTPSTTMPSSSDLRRSTPTRARGSSRSSRWSLVSRLRARLSRAFEAARGGDGRFVASPRVDSYHGVWFELHEDLIQLAGRTREEESAAGRA